MLHTTSDYLLGMDDTELLSLKYYSDDEREILYRLMRFRENVVRDGAMAEKFCRALADGS